jgi:hypothetical protein
MEVYVLIRFNFFVLSIDQLLSGLLLARLDFMNDLLGEQCILCTAMPPSSMMDLSVSVALSSDRPLSKDVPFVSSTSPRDESMTTLRTTPGSAVAVGIRESAR